MSRTATPATYAATPISASEIPAGARVVHFDQLGEAAQERLAAERRGAIDPGPIPEELAPGDVVVFTEYLRVAER